MDSKGNGKMRANPNKPWLSVTAVMHVHTFLNDLTMKSIWRHLHLSRRRLSYETACKFCLSE